jgi:hypothetical protein
MSANYNSNVALVSTTSMTTYLGVSLGSTEESECDLLINSASILAAMMCARGLDVNGVSRFLSTSRTEYFDGDGSDTLYVKAYPISSVTSLYVDPDRDYGTNTLIDTGDYVYYENEGKIVTDGALLAGGRKSIKLTYTGGYTSAPADLQQAIKELVMFWYKRNTDKRVGVASVSVGDKSISYETDIPESVKATFKRYRHWAASVA